MESDLKISIPYVVAIVGYAVAVGGYVWGMKGDIDALNHRINAMHDMQQRLTNETVSLMRRIERHEVSLDFVWRACCSDVISDSVDIKSISKHEKKREK